MSDYEAKYQSHECGCVFVRRCTLHNDLESQLAELQQKCEAAEAEIINQRSTIEAWNHAEIMKCGCHYSRVWGGIAWQHWLVPCKDHGKQKVDALEARVTKLTETLRLAEDHLEQELHLGTGRALHPVGHCPTLDTIRATLAESPKTETK